MSPNEALTLHDVAEELGVHYMTAYRYVRLGLLPAQREGRTWRIARSDLDAFGAHETPRTPRGQADWTERFTNRLLASDETGAWNVIEAALASGTTVPGGYTEIIVPALNRIGSMWEEGTIDVATEHAASEITRRVMGRLGPRMTTRGVRRGMVVVGSTATELHSLPLAILSDLLRAAHFDVANLGAYLPPDAFAAFLGAADGVVAVCIGVTMQGQDEELAATINAVRSATEAPIFVGGPGVDEAIAGRLGANGWARTADEGVHLVEEAVAASKR
jgi:excisionase family DNA binding protein